MNSKKSGATPEKVANTIDALIEKAISQRATDVHIEPRERSVVVRFRVNGFLREVTKLPSPALAGIARDLKKRTDLNPKKIRTPQSGSCTFASKQYDVSLHVATMPTINGEKITLHLSPHVDEPATLESLGFWGDTLAHIEQAVAEPHGLILANSPDSIGASLCMLGIVHLLNNPALSIATLEDPIEQHVAGANQTQFDTASGISFDAGLQALLKQDPNIVMLSQLHDRGTARTACDAAVDGRLMLGGLHADSAAHGLVRLLHVHGEAFMVAAALKLSIGLRFVQRLCPSCRQPYEPDAKLQRDLKKWLKQFGVGSIRKLHQLEIKAAAEHTGGPGAFGTTGTAITQLWRADTNGCEHCHFSGYVGHIGTCEAIINTDAMEQLLAKTPSAEQIQKRAAADGTIPLEIDGFIKALRGLTTLEEIEPSLDQRAATWPTGLRAYYNIYDDSRTT